MNVKLSVSTARDHMGYATHDVPRNSRPTTSPGFLRKKDDSRPHLRTLLSLRKARQARDDKPNQPRSTTKTTPYCCSRTGFQLCKIPHRTHNLNLNPGQKRSADARTENENGEELTEVEEEIVEEEVVESRQCEREGEEFQR
ncbi:hypothetical protein MRX96_041219 [Rhipicephalus microplus]